MVPTELSDRWDLRGRKGHKDPLDWTVLMGPTGRMVPLDLRDQRETQEIQVRRDHRDPQDWTVRMELSDRWGRKDHKDPPG